jgi:hypothetical protein
MPRIFLVGSAHKVRAEREGRERKREHSKDDHDRFPHHAASSRYEAKAVESRTLDPTLGSTECINEQWPPCATHKMDVSVTTSSPLLKQSGGKVPLAGTG